MCWACRHPSKHEGGRKVAILRANRAIPESVRAQCLRKSNALPLPYAEEGLCDGKERRDDLLPMSVGVLSSVRQTQPVCPSKSKYLPDIRLPVD